MQIFMLQPSDVGPTSLADTTSARRYRYVAHVVFTSARRRRVYWDVMLCVKHCTCRVRFEPERTGTPFLFFFWSPERRSGPFRHIAAKCRFHLNKSEKFALFGSKMPSASGGGASPPLPADQGLCPWTPLGAPPPDPHICSRSCARHILSVPVLFLTGNEPCVHVKFRPSLLYTKTAIFYRHKVKSELVNSWTPCSLYEGWLYCQHHAH